MKRVLFHVVHLLGHGHIHRAARLTAGMKARGLAVDIVHGGMPVPGFDYGADSVTDLPPLRATDATYSTIVDGDGNAPSADHMQARKDMLLQRFAETLPNVVMVEMWPFGRRAVRHELTALMQAAKGRAVAVTSVRDILQEGRKPGRSEEARDAVLELVDHVLVHADPALVPFSATFPFADTIADRIAYTGFVGPQSSMAPTEPFDVLVTAGGGAFGAELLKIASQLAAQHPDKSWCIVTGPDGADIAVPGNVTLRTRLDGLSEHMKRAKLSISQCGYNTAMDVLASGVRAVFVPHDTSGQTEQARRAALLDAAGFAVALPQSRATLETLGEAVVRARSLAPPNHTPNLDGVDRTANLIAGWLQ